MVRLSVTLDASSVRAAHGLLDAFRFLIPATRLEPGCLGCSTWKEQGGTVYYAEEWTNEAAMRERVRSHGFTLVLAILEAVQQPHVQFDFVSSTRGLDYVAEVRGAQPEL